MILMIKNNSNQNYKLYLRFKHIILHSFKKYVFFISDIDVVNDCLQWIKEFNFIMSENILKVIYLLLSVLSNI